MCHMNLILLWNSWPQMHTKFFSFDSDRVSGCRLMGNFSHSRSRFSIVGNLIIRSSLPDEDDNKRSSHKLPLGPRGDDECDVVGDETEDSATSSVNSVMLPLFARCLVRTSDNSEANLEQWISDRLEFSGVRSIEILKVFKYCLNAIFFK